MIRFPEVMRIVTNSADLRNLGHDQDFAGDLFPVRGVLSSAAVSSSVLPVN